MKEPLFHVAIKEQGANDYTGQYRVVHIIDGMHIRETLKQFKNYTNTVFLVVCPDKTFRHVNSDDCLFLGF